MYGDYFNPRSYKRSDLYVSHDVKTLEIFQSTLLQEERPCKSDTEKTFKYISIHAPTRGATPSIFDTSEEIKISIHAPTRGATI